MSKRGFTLIELMVAMVIGLAAITSVYSLGAAMSKQFYEEQRLATSQGTSRVAIMELRRDISRAGLFGSPNGTLEPTCDNTPPRLPLLGGGNGPMGAFQYYADEDTSALGIAADNPGMHADRLRVLTSLYLTDQLLVHSTDANGDIVVLQSGNQAYRRTFQWGQTAGPFTSGAAPTYLEGNLDWDSSYSSGSDWSGIGQKGARAFQTGSVLHIETPEGRHFFRSVFGKAGNIQNEIRIQVDPALPVGTACLPGAAEGSNVAPLQWVEYAVVDPFNTAHVGTDFYDFDGLFYIDLSGGGPAVQLDGTTKADLRESPNYMLIRRILNSSTGNVVPNTTQVVAEFVTTFDVSFLFDNKVAPGDAPSLAIEDRTTGAEGDVNAEPENVRAVIIRLGIRNPLEDPDVKFLPDAGTRYDTNTDQKGAARVRTMEIEIPVMNVARRNL